MLTTVDTGSGMLTEYSTTIHDVKWAQLYITTRKSLAIALPCTLLQ